MRAARWQMLAWWRRERSRTLLAEASGLTRPLFVSEDKNMSCEGGRSQLPATFYCFRNGEREMVREER